MLYVTDTHPLLWYVSGSHAKLSRKALAAFEAAEAGRSLIYIPSMVLFEVSLLNSKEHFVLSQPFAYWVDEVLSGRGFEFASVDLSVTLEAHSLLALVDPFDALIAATARVMDAPLITKDQRITDSRLVDLYW